MSREIVIHIGEIHVHYGDTVEVLEAIADLKETIMTQLDTSTAAETKDLNALVTVVGQLEAALVALQSSNNPGLQKLLDAANLDATQQATILDGNDKIIQDALTAAQAVLNGSGANTGANGPPVLVFADQTVNVVTGATVLDSIEASGGTGAISFSSGDTQNGLSIDATGELTGVSAVDGTFEFPVRATDSGTPTPQSVDATITVVSASAGGGETTTAPEAPTLATTALPDAVTGQPYTGSLSFAGGTGAIRVTNAPLTENGVTIATDGTVSGTAAADGEATFEVDFQDSATPPVTGTGEVTLNSAAAQTIDQQ